MTADPRRRRRASTAGVIALASSFVLIVVLAVVAVVTLRSSEEGTEVAADARPEQRFPSTPLAIVGVTSGDRLTSLAVMVLDPAGQGGSIVTVPVNIDTTGGVGDERTPLARRAMSPDDPAALADELAPVLGVAPSFVQIVDASGLVGLLGDLDAATVQIDEPVLDVGDDGSVATVLDSGERRVDRDDLVAALTAVPPADAPTEAQHRADVAVWAGIAEEWSLTNEPLDLQRDEAGVPVDPATFEELVGRLRSGRVGVRDLAVDRRVAATLDNPTNADFVVVDNRDATLVFAGIAPDRVLTPNPTLTFSIVAPFSRAQLATMGSEATSEELVRTLIGELAFFYAANVVAVDVRPLDDGAAAATVVIVDDPAFEAEAPVPGLIGPSTVQIAARDTDGSDVVLVLGTDFLEYRAAVLAQQEADRADDDGGADFEVTGDDGEESATGDEGATVDGDE